MNHTQITIYLAEQCLKRRIGILIKPENYETPINKMGVDDTDIKEIIMWIHDKFNVNLPWHISDNNNSPISLSNIAYMIKHTSTVHWPE